MTPGRPRVVVLGTISLDTIESRGRVAREVLGGSAPYFAAAARLSCDVALVGVIGDDFPAELLRPLEALGVDVSAIERKPGETFRWHARYRADGSRETLGTNRERALRDEPSVPLRLRDPDVLFLGSTNPHTQARVLAACAAPGLVVLDTMAHWVRDFREAFLAVASQANVVLLAHDEALELGRGDAHTGVQTLLEAGCTWVVVKRGEQGATAFSHARSISAPSPPPSDVVDPTGAGDAFAGGLVGALARQMHDPVFRAPSVGLDMEQALSRATALGSLAVESFSLERLMALTLEQSE